MVNRHIQTDVSSLTYETFTQWGTNGWWAAALNLIGSMVLGMLATLAGVVLARMI